MVGKIAHLVEGKGYGFIKTEEHENGIFFHAKSLKNVRFEELQKGDEVEFDEIKESDRGLSAHGIRVGY